MTSFDPITIVSDAPSIIVVQPSLNISTLRELQGAGAKQSGKLNFEFSRRRHATSSRGRVVRQAGRRQVDPYPLSRFAGGDRRYTGQ